VAALNSLTFTTAAAQGLDPKLGGAPVDSDAPVAVADPSSELAAPAATTAVVPPSAAQGGGDTSVATTAMAAATSSIPSGHFELADRVVVRKSTRRLQLMREDHVIADYPIRLGLNPVGAKEREGDFRTPEGRYWLTRRNQASDFFLSIEVSYPNDTDRLRARRLRAAPGGSIMIHGLPNFPRKPADYYVRNDWTDGCIAVSNSDMVDIWLRTRVGLPIEIRP
jgi:murein L,D-transpeptidase YafK